MAAVSFQRDVPRSVLLSKMKGPAYICDLISRITGKIMPLSREALQVMDGSNYVFSSAKAASQLNWNAGRPLQDFQSYLGQLAQEWGIAQGGVIREVVRSR